MHIWNKNLNGKQAFFALLALWLVANLLQSIFTGMSSDESYYALWGKHLAWGYYDHPPMIAVFNFLSALIFNGNMGVRFLTVITQIGTLLLVWRIIDEQKADKHNIGVFFILAASLPMFVALGFITTPDAPLQFFIALFLLSYKRFLKTESFLNTLLLSLAMAGMVYSKYQSILVVGFIVLSNLRMLLKTKFWLAGIFALVLLVPHIYWQYSSNFPSLQYHLVDRNNQFKFNYFLEYLPNQMAVFNPLTLGLIVYVLFKFKTKDIFDKGLNFLIVGFILFFWATAYRGHVEPHWTVACSIPMILILYAKAKENDSIKKFITKWIFGSVILIIIFRIALVCTPLAGKIGYDQKSKFKAIETIAGDVPVVFASSFQNPSLYSFFANKPTTTISSIYSRRTQFDIWQFEQDFEGKPVFVYAEIEGLSKKFHVNDQIVPGFFVDNFHSAMRLKVKAGVPTKKIMHCGDTIRVSFTLFNPYSHAIDFKDKTFPVSLCACFFTRKTKEICPIVSNTDITQIKPLEILSGKLYTIVPKIPEGEYTFSITLNSIFGPTLENEMVKIKIDSK